jgi:hypothetical protein
VSDQAYVTEKQALDAAIQVLRESWDPPEIHPMDGQTVWDGPLGWSDAIKSISGYEAIDSKKPAYLVVETWSVMFDDPRVMVALVIDASGEVCAAGIFDESDM